MSQLFQKLQHLFPIKKIDIKTMTKILVSMNDINAFFTPESGRGKNDSNNSKREFAVELALKGNIPKDWIARSDKWKTLNLECERVMGKLTPEHTDEIQVSHKGGRKFNYDFEIKFLQNGNITKTEKIEFKYNASSVEDCPQFSSPMKLSQYMDGIPYEEFFYNNYLGLICELFNEPKPTLVDYLKQIHNNKPKCIHNIQEKYYKGAKGSSRYTGEVGDIEKTKQCKSITHESIRNYLMVAKLNAPKLSEYLKKSQHKKQYLMWKNNKMTLKSVDSNDYDIISVDEKIKNNNTIVAHIKSGCKLDILLRWKNGNGIAFPAFQIKSLGINK
jgi:hypothetical protein